MNSPPPFIISLLRSSTNLIQINQIHAQIIIHRYPIHNHLLFKLVDLCSINYARAVFDRIPFPNDHSWNSVIKAYALNGPFQNSLFLYSQMLREGVSPSNFTYPFVIKACSVLSAIEQGEQMHTHVIKFGFEYDIFVNNSLIDMYCKCSNIGAAYQVLDEMSERGEVSWNSMISGCVYCGEVGMARDLFDDMPVRRNVVCWTALINGYGKDGKLVEMLGLFRRMLISTDDVRPNSATMVCLASACSGVANFKMGRWVSVFIDVNGMHLDVTLSTALMDMYLKCGNVDKAERLFEKIPGRNLVCWNAMITGYVQCGLLEEAIQLYYRMQADLVKPNEITMVNLLSACSGLGALELGKQVHLYLGRNGLQLNVILATALVDMYSKCGSIDDACLVFVKTRKKDVVLWNAMILGLAIHGNARDSLAVFAEMECVGTKPNDVTFIGVLSACNHSGLVNEGRVHFKTMLLNHKLSPKVEHFACMVDLLGRAGHLNEAVEMVRNMSVPPDSIIWVALLSACRIHRNVKLADEVGQIMLSSHELNLGCCILLSNLYANVGRWTDVARMRRLIKEKGVKKPSGCSWIEVDGVVYKFLVEDTRHARSTEIYDILRRLMKQLRTEGYVPNLDFVLKNIDGM